ncbi:MAG TPA: YfhO family protein [Thermoanaerobaculia bacterium]|nr:YfhO family protein [Thermoanaerobaculia bacterium]
MARWPLALTVPALLYLLSAAGALVLVRRFMALSRPVAAVLILLPLCLTGRALVTGGVYAPIDLAYHFDPLASMATKVGIDRIANPLPSDVTVQFLPWNAGLRWAITHGQWPLWNPFELGGNVLAAAAQSAPFHPITLLGLLLPMPGALGFMASMTYFLAALGMFLFLRNLALRSLPSLFGAAGWMLSTYVITYTHTAHGNAIALLPLVMLGARMVARNPGVRAAAMLAGALILLTLCGHPETSLHIIALSAAYLIFCARGRWGLVIVSGLGAGIAALLLTAFFLLPMIDAIPQTREYQHRRSGAEATIASWRTVAHVLTLDVIPFADGTPGIEETRHDVSVRHRSLGTAYCGAMMLAPALLALVRARTREKYFFLAVILFGLLMGAEAPGVTNVFADLPVFSLAINARMISFAAFGICVLGPIGLQLSLAARRSLAWMFLGVALTITIAVVIIAVEGTLTPDFIRANAIREVVPLLLAFALLRAFTVPRAVLAGLLALLLLQRVMEIGGFIPTVDRRAFFPPIAGFEQLSRNGEPYRVVAQGPLFAPDISALYGLEDVRGYQAMTFARLAETFPLWSIPQPVWSNRVDDLTAPMLSLMNVRYALALPETVPTPGWRLVGKYPGYQLLENSAALPRAFIPRLIHSGASDVIAGMRACRDFASEGWIETTGAPASAANGEGTVAVRALGSRVTLHASMRSPGWIVISETAWRGWAATMGHQRLKVHFADRAFLGIYVPAGEHDIELSYRPKAVTTGAIISVVSALAMVVLWGVRRRVWGVGAKARELDS